MGLGGALVLEHGVVHRRVGKVVPCGADDRGRGAAASLASQAKEKGFGIGRKKQQQQKHF